MRFQLKLIALPVRNVQPSFLTRGVLARNMLRLIHNMSMYARKYSNIIGRRACCRRRRRRRLGRRYADVERRCVRGGAGRTGGSEIIYKVRNIPPLLAVPHISSVDVCVCVYVCFSISFIQNRTWGWHCIHIQCMCEFVCDTV